LLDDLLNLEIFDTLIEEQVLVERWYRRYDRPQPATGCRSPILRIEHSH
jgi:hypothetical protein